MTDVYNCPSCGEESICTPECEGLRVAFRDITHRVEVAEQELRETAGELEKARARVTEATALLAECLDNTAGIPEEQATRIKAFLSSRAPAQPAAPTPDPVCEYDGDGCTPVFRDAEPAAPEPSAGSIRRLDMQPGILLSRAESAEAQLAAVRRVVDRLRNAALPVDPQLIVQKLDQALTPAPSPGAGGDHG